MLDMYDQGSSFQWILSVEIVTMGPGTEQNRDAMEADGSGREGNAWNPSASDAGDGALRGFQVPPVLVLFRS